MKILKSIAIGLIVILTITGVGYFAITHLPPPSPPFTCPSGQQVDSDASDNTCFTQPTCSSHQVLASDNETCSMDRNWGWNGNVTFVINYIGHDGAAGTNVPTQRVYIVLNDGESFNTEAYNCITSNGAYFFYAGQTVHVHQNYWDWRSTQWPYWVVDNMPGDCDFA
jgi:hypothetical protein